MSNFEDEPAEPPVAYPGVPPDSERANRPPLPEVPYKPYEKAAPPEAAYEPYAKKPGAAEVPYKPYAKKPGAEVPYEPYKGM